MSIPLKNKEIVKEGSLDYVFQNAQMLTGTSVWIELVSQFPACRQFLPLDRAEVLNNSAQDITVYPNTTADAILIPAYMTKILSNRALWRVRLTNSGAGTIAAAEVTINFRRLPKGMAVSIVS